VAESRAPQASRPDWAGFALFTVALSSLVYGLIESNQRSFTDGLVLGCLAAAAVLLAVFVIVEQRSAHPMFDLKLLRLPTFSGGSVAAFGLSASIFSVLLYLARSASTHITARRAGCRSRRRVCPSRRKSCEPRWSMRDVARRPPRPLCGETEPQLEVKAGDATTHVTACHFPVMAGENLAAAGRSELS